MWERFSRHWFLIAIAVCLAGGYFGAESLRGVRSSVLFRDGVVFVVLLLMGLSLQPAAVGRSLRRPLQSLVAVLINVVGVPLLALPMAWILSERDYGGLVIASLVPCTLASASVWTRKGGGDDSIAILVTVVTNLACIVVIPIGMSWMLRQSTIELSATDQMLKLAMIVVFPLVLAQVIRRAGAGGWADRKKLRLAWIAQFGILIMVTLGAAAGADTTHEVTAEGGQANSAGPWGAILVGLSAVGMHLAALAGGVGLSRVLGGNRGEQIAVGISGSQKTLMVGLQIAIDCGVSVLPMILYHVGQLTLDTVVVERWKRGSLAGQRGGKTEPNGTADGSPVAESGENSR